MKNFTRLANVFSHLLFHSLSKAGMNKKPLFFSPLTIFVQQKKITIFAREALIFTPVSEQLDRLKNRSA